MSNRATNKTNPHYQRDIIIWVIAASLAIYGGMGLGSLDIWEDAAVLRKFCLSVGAILSVSLGGLISWGTLKKKGYVNLLWFALPVPILTGIDLVFRFLFGAKYF